MKSVYSFEFSVGDSLTLTLVLSLVTDTVQQVVPSVCCVTVSVTSGSVTVRSFHRPGNV